LRHPASRILHDLSFLRAICHGMKSKIEASPRPVGQGDRNASKAPSGDRRPDPRIREETPWMRPARRVGPDRGGAPCRGRRASARGRLIWQQRQVDVAPGSTGVAATAHRMTAAADGPAAGPPVPSVLSPHYDTVGHRCTAGFRSGICSARGHSRQSALSSARISRPLHPC
jgi:hypothetical protein